jgi:LmbE family N-acetylglucosaminyl deacetylase
LPLRLLCITAHPDDEAGGFAGALLHAHTAGVETRVLCLTEGRAASNRGEAKSDEELGAMRRGEFAEACRILKVTHGEVLDYPDGDLLHLNFYAVVSMLVEHIRRYRPQVVLTFGGDGGPNIHRDHTMAGLFATAAFHWSGRSFFAPEHFEAAPDGPGLSPYAPQKLYYPSTSFIVSKWKEEAEAAPKTPTSLVLAMGEYKQVKAQAVEIHSSQAVMERAREVYEKFGHEERYLLIAARDPELMGKEQSMFDGVMED